MIQSLSLAIKIGKRNKEVISPKTSYLLLMNLLKYNYKMICKVLQYTSLFLLPQGHCYWTIGKELWGGGDRWAVIGQWSTWPQSSPVIGQGPGHHGDDRAAAGRRRGPRRGQEADGGEDVADRGDPVRGVLAPLPHILHPRILRAKYVDTHNTKSSIFCFDHFRYFFQFIYSCSVLPLCPWRYKLTVDRTWSDFWGFAAAVTQSHE